MKRVGAHVSAAGGVSNAPRNAHSIGARAFALFTKNQKQWNAKPLDDDEIAAFKQACRELNYTPRHILPHDSYLINLAHPDSSQWQKSREAFLDELRRCEQLGLHTLNFHPGSTLGKITDDDGLKRIAEGVNWALQRTASVAAVIENTAGQGNQLGHSFEQLARLLERIEGNRKGVCIDTAHAFAAGYDLRTEEAWHTTMQEFDDIVGFAWLRGVHLNDSLKDLGSRVDRHAPLGEGLIGETCFRLMMNDERFDEIPLILETPNREDWQAEITRLYAMVRD